MKTKLYGLFLALFGAVTFIGCDDNDDLNPSDLPNTVLESFETKYPAATRVEWEKKGIYFVAEFWQDGIETHAWYNNEGGWSMTEYDLGVNVSLLPQAVQTTFQASSYASWYIEDINKYERPGEVFYLIEVETVGQPEYNLYYGEDGTLLKEEVDRENDDVTPDTKL